MGTCSRLQACSVLISRIFSCVDYLNRKNIGKCVDSLRPFETFSAYLTQPECEKNHCDLLIYRFSCDKEQGITHALSGSGKNARSS